MDEQPEGPTTRRWWKRGVWGAVCLVAAVGIILWAAGSPASAASGYRTAVASVATVRQTLSVSGTTEPVHQATAEFQVAGTVSAVDVAAGQKVTAGQTLASLDTTSLSQAVSSAQLSVSAAEATLSENEAGQSATSSSAGSGGGGATASLTADVTSAASAPTTGTGSPTGGPSTQSSTITADQQAVVAAQKTEDADSATAAADFAQAQTVCSATGGGTTTTTTSPSTTTTTTASGSSTVCADTLSTSLADQEQVTADQTAVATAESALAQALSSSTASSTGSSGGTTGGGAAPSGTTGGSAAPSGTTGGSAKGGSTGGASSQSTDTAQQLASDQAAIDTANATLIEAQQSLADAQLTAPIDGTVASVSITSGQTVTAGSTTDTITIINSGSYQITSSLTSTQASKVKVGDEALVTIDGKSGTLTGTVARVGPVDTSGSSYTYPLVVALPAGSHGIAAGSTAQVQVVLHRVVGTLSVPTSAVHVTGTASAYVNILRSGQLVRKKVTIGAIGGASTQITSGISAGTSVVLADLSEAVPSSSTSASTRSFGGSGFPSGGGIPSGAGFPSGGGFGG